MKRPLGMRSSYCSRHASRSTRRETWRRGRLRRPPHLEDECGHEREEAQGQQAGDFAGADADILTDIVAQKAHLVVVAPPPAAEMQLVVAQRPIEPRDRALVKRSRGRVGWSALRER